MNPKPNKAPRISDEEFKRLLIKEIAKPDGCGHSKTNFYELLRTKYTIHKQRALQLHSKYYSELIDAKNKALEGESIANDVEALKTGLKSKSARVLFLQNEIDTMQKQLAGEIQFTWLNFGKVMKSHDADGKFMLPIQVQNEIRRTMREYQIEISKIEGDYAPKKQDITLDTKKGVTGFILEE